MEQEHRLTAAVVFHMNRNAVDLQHFRLPFSLCHNRSPDAIGQYLSRSESAFGRPRSVRSLAPVGTGAPEPKITASS
jgi:hypothetical protein